jgi:HPt (histidine-containing phosphotransfer) domain-containing protein
MDTNSKIVFLEENGVDAKPSIENMMGIENYDEIMTDFYNELPNDLAKIDAFKSSQDMPNYAILVHALKSNARSFGFMKLGDIAYAHEMASKAGDVNYVNEHYDELINAAKNVQDIIGKYKAL